MAQAELVGKSQREYRQQIDQRQSQPYWPLERAQDGAVPVEIVALRYSGNKHILSKSCLGRDDDINVIKAEQSEECDTAISVLTFRSIVT